METEMMMRITKMPILQTQIRSVREGRALLLHLSNRNLRLSLLTTITKRLRRQKNYWRMNAQRARCLKPRSSRVPTQLFNLILAPGLVLMVPAQRLVRITLMVERRSRNVRIHPQVRVQNAARSARAPSRSWRARSSRLSNSPRLLPLEPLPRW